MKAMANDGIGKKNIIIIILIVITTLIFLLYHVNTKNSNLDTNKKANIINEKEYLTREEIITIVEHSIIENQNEINELGNDNKKISKLLYSKVMRKSKGQVKPNEVKVAIELVLNNPNKE